MKRTVIVFGLCGGLYACGALVGANDFSFVDPTSDGGDGNEGGDAPGPLNDGGDADAASDAPLDAPVDAADAATTYCTNLISWWRSENDTVDSKSTNNGAWLGTSVYAAGKNGQAFRVNTAGDNSGRIEVPTAASLNFGLTDNFSISVWVFAEEYDLRAVDKIGNGGSVGYLLDLFALGGLNRRPRFGVGDTAAAPLVELTASAWHHLVGVYDGSASQLPKLYVDGVLVATAPAAPIAVPSSGLNLTFGDVAGGGAGRRGSIDEIAMFRQALSASDVSKIFNAGGAALCP